MREKEFGRGVSFFVLLCVFSVSCFLLHHLDFALSGAADFCLNCSAAFFCDSISELLSWKRMVLRVQVFELAHVSEKELNW